MKITLPILGRIRLTSRSRLKIGLQKFRDTKGAINTRPTSLKNKFCSRPFEFLDIASGGICWSCCPTWLPVVTGKLKSTDSLIDTFNSPMAKAVRASILDGSYKYCDHKTCCKIQNDALPDKDKVKDPFHRTIIDENRTVISEGPRCVAANYDGSCNLSCPSCRPAVIQHNEGRQYDKAMTYHKILLDYLSSCSIQENIKLILTGAGDCFGSKIIREFLFDLDGAKYPNVSLVLKTNGVMFTEKYWNKLEKIHNNIDSVSISIDAATAETYNIVRRGGDWAQLIDNLSMLAQKRKEGKLKNLTLNFVAQQYNFREIPDFVRLGLSLGVNHIAFALIFNQSFFEDDYWTKAAIWRKDHPEFDEFLEVMKDPILDHKIVGLGNLNSYRKLAKKKQLNDYQLTQDYCP